MRLTQFPYVQARYDYGRRSGPALGFVVHKAEGGGTVGYLARDPARGVSVHFVIEYAGRIVQMLGLDRVSGSINPNALRTTNDSSGFGVAAAKQVLGTGWSNPNHFTITLEIEGYARDALRAVQASALITLARAVRAVGGVRADLVRLRGNLGHRDFADYKACPGLLIPWTSISGHGLFSIPVEVSDVLVETTITRLPAAPALFTVPAGTTLYGWKLDPAKGDYVKALTRTFASQSTAHFDAYHDLKRYPAGDPSGRFLHVTDGAFAGMLIYSGRVKVGAIPTPPDPAEEYRRGFAVAKQKASAAVGAITPPA